MQNSSKFYRLAFFFLVVFLIQATPCISKSARQFHAIAYHGVVDTREQLASDDITLETLVNHFEWLLANNYHPISISQLVDANTGQSDLPEKAVLLCWDDGYTSFYTHVLPLLEAYQFPAVLGLVGSWMATPQGELVRYGNGFVPREKFLSWQQVKEIATSPLVEIGSHSFNLHQGLLTDKSGDMLPAVIAHKYHNKSGAYETDLEMFERIYNDLSRNIALIHDKTGVTPQVMVWPFGRYNTLAIKAAQKAGMEITLTLDPVVATTDQLDAVGRIYPTLNPETGSFKYSFFEPNRPPLRRFFFVKTSDLLEPATGDERIFSIFLERVKTISPARVYLSPVIRKGSELHAMFLNSSLPTAQDRLNRLSWHTNRRGGTEVHLTLDDELFSAIVPEDYNAFFHEMGKSAPCSGLLLADSHFTQLLFESKSIRQHTQERLSTWNPNATRKQRKMWMRETSNRELIRIFSAIEKFQEWQPFLDVGLLVPFDTLQNADATKIKTILHSFDYIMVDFREEDSRSEAIKQFSTLSTLQHVRQYLPVLIEFPLGNKADTLADQFNTMLAHGIVDYGYTYDNFEQDMPTAAQIIPLISTRTYPFIPK